MPCTVLVHYTANDGQGDQVVDFLRGAHAFAATREGHRGAEVLQDDTQREAVCSLQRWESADQHAAFAAALAGSPKQAELEALLAAPPITRTCTTP